MAHRSVAFGVLVCVCVCVCVLCLGTLCFGSRDFWFGNVGFWVVVVGIPW